MQFICKILLIFLFLLISPTVILSSQVHGAEEVIHIEVNGTISKELTYENVMYLVGDFTQVRLSGSNAISRNNIAMIDLNTQSLLPWDPTFNGAIRDIEAYNDYLFLVGDFTTVSGENHQYFLVVDKNTNTILEPPVAVNAPVYTVERYNKTLFVGGNFTSFAGAERSYLASFNLENSTLNSWSPILNGPVRSVVIHDDILYVAGEFTQVEALARNYLVAFYLPSGIQSSWSPAINTPIESMSLRDSTLVIVSQNPDTDEIAESIIPLERITQMPIQPITEVSLTPSVGDPAVQGLMVDTSKLGFAIPTLSDLLTFAVRIFFVIAGLAALFYMLIGAFAWVTSGGDKDAVGAARDKIQAAVVGLIMMVVVLAIVWTLEQVVFKRRICLGVSCPLTLPSLLEPIN